MVSVEEDDLAGLEDVSSDGEDDNYEADSTDGETASTGAAAIKKPIRKRARVDPSEPLPLMEGEGRSFRVLGFNQNQRTAFVQILMRFGVGEFDWAEFTPRLKQKTYDEIKNYGRLFLSHIAEELTDSPTFSDGVPKEGLRIPDVLVRIAELLLVRDKKWDVGCISSVNAENIRILARTFLMHIGDYLPWLVECCNASELSKTLFFLVLSELLVLPEIGPGF